jgi:cell division protein FtsQ
LNSAAKNRVIFKAAALTTSSAVRKITEYGKSAGLLEPEQANGLSRPQRHAETADIPDTVLEETANAETGEPFLRARQRVPVRRRGGSRFTSKFSWNNRWLRIAAVLVALAGLGLVAAVAWEAKSVLLHNSHFVLGSTENIQVSGNRVVATRDVLAYFASDIGHSVFRVPLAKCQSELEQIRWVRRVTVMRLWPDRLRIGVLERTPVAFARDGNSVRLVDDDGVLLDLPNAAEQHYSFPVLTGLSSSDPLSTRATRIQKYRQFVQALDAEGGHISATLSEVDLSDAEDLRAVFIGGPRQPLVHFGDADFLPRYRAYQAHLAEWLQQYPLLRSVDMRYGKQVVLDTGTAAPVSPAPLDTSEPAIRTPPAAVAASAPVEAASHHATSASKANAAKSKTRRASPKKSAPGKHRAAIHKKRVPSHAPERGHTVRNPIMHVVTKT